MFPLYAENAAIAGAPGLLMTPDAAARKMYYTRVKIACPHCGSFPESRMQTPAGSYVCPECGYAPPAALRVVDDLPDIDALIAEFDRRAEKKGA